MDLNSLKEKTRSVKAPESPLKGVEGVTRPLDALIARLQEQDTSERKRFRRMMIVSAAAALVYLLIFTLTWIYPPDGNAASSRLVMGLFTVIFLSIGLVSGLKARERSGIDFKKPVGSFLEDAERRYRFINMRDLWFIVPYLVVVTVAGAMAWMNGFERYLPYVEPSARLASFCVFWILAFTAGVVLGARDWKKRKAPILREIRRLRTEITSEEQERSNEA